MPWYNSNFACWLYMVLSATVLFFAGSGLNTALKNTAYKDFIWLPSMLGGLCLLLVINTVIRLIRRSKMS